jgi:hypothetical protein
MARVDLAREMQCLGKFLLRIHIYMGVVYPTPQPTQRPADGDESFLYYFYHPKGMYAANKYIFIYLTFFKSNVIGHIHVINRCYCECSEMLVFLAPTVP